MGFLGFAWLGGVLLKMKVRLHLPGCGVCLCLACGGSYVEGARGRGGVLRESVCVCACVLREREENTHRHKHTNTLHANKPSNWGKKKAERGTQRARREEMNEGQGYLLVACMLHKQSANNKKKAQPTTVITHEQRNGPVKKRQPCDFPN